MPRKQKKRIPIFLEKIDYHLGAFSVCGSDGIIGVELVSYLIPAEESKTENFFI